MAGKGFSLSMYPWVYLSQYISDQKWLDCYQEQPHKTPSEEAVLNTADLNELLNKRNSFPELPLVNYTTQYGFGCFEGLKAFPQIDGTLKIFRPDENAARFRKSMEGLMLPGFPEEKFIEAAKKIVKNNQELGFFPAFDPLWKNDDYISGHSVYLRPFTHTEGAIGLGLSEFPWVIIIATPVGSYFSAANCKALTTNRIRATPNGTGWIKCASNYVISILAKKEAENADYMEAIFLDSQEQKYLEEGSSCNLFIYLKNGTLVTPALGDTILPGITRKSIITLAKEQGVKVEERKISIEEAMTDAKEVFVSGTAAGLAHLESITHKGKTAVISNGKMGDLSRTLLKTLKEIQYGAIEDKHGWMFSLD